MSSGNRITIEFEDVPIKPRLAMSDSIAIQQVKEFDRAINIINKVLTYRPPAALGRSVKSCCRAVKDIAAGFVREPQGFQNTRTSFFERVTAVTEYYGVLERVVQPKEKSYVVGTFRDEALCFLGDGSYANDR